MRLLLTTGLQFTVLHKLKSILLGLLLIAIGPLLLTLLIELGFRGYYHYEQQLTGSLEQQLQRAQSQEPTTLEQSPTMGALVQPSPYPDIVYELKRKATGTFLGKAFSSNSIGLRDKEFTLEKPANTIRIVGLGDSIMFGWGVEQDESYLKLLESKLQSKHPNQSFEVMNFAVPGYNTAMEVATFEHKALAFDPDLVILHFVDNDFGVPLFMQKPKNVFDLTRSFFIDFIKQRLGFLESSEQRLQSSSLRHLEGEKRQSVLDQYRPMIGPEGFNRALKKLHSLTQPRGIPVIVLISNAKGRMKQTISTAAARWGFPLVELKPFVDRYMQEHETINTIERRKELFWVSDTDSHPNKLGHQIYSEALFGQIDATLAATIKGATD